jgi:hypothetical protein
MATDIREQIVQRRLDRMRLGQAVCDQVNLVSDPEIRLAIVPLSDAEAGNALVAAAMIDVPDNVAGLMARDHKQKVELLAYAIRDPQDLDKRLYRNGVELQEELQESDVNHLYDCFLEMQENSNPAIEGIDPEEFEELKKALQEITWSELSGRSWFAAKRFLGALIQDGQLRGNLHGSSSTMKSTTTSD